MLLESVTIYLMPFLCFYKAICFSVSYIIYQKSVRNFETTYKINQFWLTYSSSLNQIKLAYLFHSHSQSTMHMPSFTVNGYIKTFALLA